MEEYKSPLIIRLDIDENDLDSGVTGIALVANAAIEEDFYLFSKQEMKSYSDYPDAVKNNAKRGIELNEKVGNKCATQVGKVRAQQLANGEPVSVETIKRMYSYLSRAEEYYDESDSEACGTISYLLWGGKSAKSWAESKLKQIEQLKKNFVENADGFSIGDYVSWTYAGRSEGDDRARGQIKDLRVSGKLKVPGTDFELSPTEDRPAALIETIDGTLVGQYTDSLRKIQKPEGFEIDVTGLPDYVNEVSASMDIPVFDNVEEAIIYSMVIGCEGEIHTHTLANGTTIYMPCVDMEAVEKVIDIIKGLQEEPKYLDSLPIDVQDKIMARLEEVAQNVNDLLDNKEEFAIASTEKLSSIMDYGKFKIRYRYVGPYDDKNRNFCRRILDFQNRNDIPGLGKKGWTVFRKEDINNMTINAENDQFGVYDIFKYYGSYGCRHYWETIEIDTITGVVSTIQISGPNPKPTRNRNPNSDTLIDKEAPKSEFKTQDKEKRIIAGPLMIPDKMIYRSDDNMGEYFVYFTTDTIEKIAHKYMVQKRQDSANLEHSEYAEIEDVALVESWIIEDTDNDKSYALTGKKYPKGTWFGMMKINNKEVWYEWIKSGQVSGFSVEGYFTDFVINASKQSFYYRTTEGGTEIVIDHNTNVVFILEDGERVAVMPDGTHKLTNGRTLVVRDGKAVKDTFAS